MSRTTSSELRSDVRQGRRDTLASPSGFGTPVGSAGVRRPDGADAGDGVVRPGARSPRDTQELHKAQIAAGRFARALQVLLRAAKLYQKNHPHVMESLEAAERELRGAFERVSPLELRFEKARVLFRGQPLPDPRDDLKKLADSLLRRGISILAFSPRAHLGELGTLAQLVGNSPLQPGQDEALDWASLVADYRLQGVRINAPVEERKADTVLTTLVATVLAANLPDHLQPAPAGASAIPVIEASPVTAEAHAPATFEESAGVLQLLARIAEPLRMHDEVGPQQVVVALRSAIASSDRAQVQALAGGITRHAPRQGENLESYFSRLAEALVTDIVGAQFREGRTPLPKLRELFLVMAREMAVSGLRPKRRHGAKWTDDSYAESLLERFWDELPANDKAHVLTGREAWCVPVPTLRTYLEQLATAGGERQARFLLLNYARGLEAEESRVRLAVATGLSELSHLIAALWPPSSGAPRELARTLLRALPAEPAPEVASVLAGVLDGLARQAVERRDFAELEYLLDTLDKAPRNGSHQLVNTIMQRMLDNGRWTAVIEAALEHRPLDQTLPRILGRDPERVIEHLSARLTAGELDALAPMARLLRAIGDAAIGTLVTRLFDPRTQRATAAVKLLTVTAPEALVDSLPRAMAGWDWALQDLAAGELVRLGLPGTARAFLEALPQTHELVVPMMIDEIGMEGEAAAIPLLMETAAGRADRARAVFIRIKAVEALGRMRAFEAADVLRTIVRQRNGLTYAEPTGLRAAAEEALALIENRPSSGRVRSSYQASEKASLSFTRARRYMRVPLPSPLTARIVPPERPVAEGAPSAVRAAAARVSTISLGGAFVESKQRLNVGESFALEIRSGLRKISGTAVVRNISPAGGGVEFVHMKQEDREKLRQLVSRLLRK
ncbi:MAG: PilZ domain-containing protein [Candidatus Acidiferrales bacterium]